MTARPHRCLVTGGARSGKSAFAEARLSGYSVRYVATGYPGSLDEEWAARVERHRSRRPQHWRTVETLDVAGELSADPAEPLLIDCLTLWLTRTFDRHGAWSIAAADTAERVAEDMDALVAALESSKGDVVLVTNEIGWGVVPASPGARVFADTLGSLNRRVAEVCDEVVLLVAGIPMTLKGEPTANPGGGW